MPDNLPELRDIHLPEGVSAFPPAYGWFVSAGVLISLFFLGKIIKLARQKSQKLYALRLLGRLPLDKYLAAAVGMSEILRRICVYKYPSAASLSGQDWIEFLNAHSKTKMTKKTADLLLNAPYMPETGEKDFSVADALKLKEFCKKWIGENL